MKNIFLLFLVIGCFDIGLLAQTAPRIANSPYPVSTQPDSLYMVNMDLFTQPQQVTVITLQGLLAKVKPRIMVTRGTPAFRSDLQEHYGVTYDSTYFDDFRGLIEHFKPQISGYILTPFGDTSGNAAISICSHYNAITVNPADTAFFDSLGIPMLNSTFG